MIGYRPGTRIAGALFAGATVAISIFIMVVPGASGVRIGGLVFMGFTLFFLRVTYGPAVKIRGDTLIVDQPLWRWEIPRSAVVGVVADGGTMLVTTTRGEIMPFTFSHSAVANLIDGDKHRMAAISTVDKWRRGGASGDSKRPVVWNVKPLLLQAVVLLGGWQVVYSLVLLFARG